jgi:two-component SAPR family response regulator
VSLIILIIENVPLITVYHVQDKLRVCTYTLPLDKTVRIIFITASEAYYEEFRNEHFPELVKINYIQKPIGNQELVQIVNTLVANSITAVD